MNYNFTPSIFLGLFDYVQVILFFIGMIYLWKFSMKTGTKLSLSFLVPGTVVATLAGLSKATWKLLFALTGTSVDILNNVHMYGLALGTTLIFIGTILLCRKNKSTQIDTTTHAIAFFPVVISLLTISTIGYLTCLIIISARKKYTMALVSFAIYMVIALANAGLSGGGEHEMTHWIAQSMGVVANAFLINGTRTLYKGVLKV